jgi:hypothetical protein
MQKQGGEMKNLIFFLVLLITMALVQSCSSLKLNAGPYGSITTETDSRIFAYTDADVKINRNGVIRSDDTTLIVIGIRDNTGADLTSIFNNAMARIKDIFHERQAVYKAWLTRSF